MCPFLKVLLEGHPSPCMWALGPTPNLLSKCQRALVKDKDEGRSQTLASISHCQGREWVRSALIRPVYLLPCRNAGPWKKPRMDEGGKELSQNSQWKKYQESAGACKYLWAPSEEEFNALFKGRSEMAEQMGMFLSFFTTESFMVLPLLVARRCNIRGYICSRPPRPSLSLSFSFCPALHISPVSKGLHYPKTPYHYSEARPRHLKQAALHLAQESCSTNYLLHKNAF